MQIKKILSMLSLINLLTACSSMSGNVVPQKGPTMEEVYDSVVATNSIEIKKISLTNEISSHSTKRDFYLLPNPELTMYVFPHFAGNDEVPIPGYETLFSAYNHSYYDLKYNV